LRQEEENPARARELEAQRRKFEQQRRQPRDVE
jgi:hypothetical protein